MTGKNKTDGRLGKKFNAADEKSYRVGYGRPPVCTENLSPNVMLGEARQGSGVM